MNRHGGRRLRAQRMYRRLVRLYPSAHRRAFGEQMVQTFGDHYRDVVEDHGGSRLRFWVAVLADAGTSLLTEHAAELRARGRRRTAVTAARAAAVRPVRAVLAVLTVLVTLVGAGLGTVMAWLAYAMRLARRVPAGPHGDGPVPPGGAGVREPRRPLPMSPAGAAARPVPDQDPPVLIS